MRYLSTMDRFFASFLRVEAAHIYAFIFFAWIIFSSQTWQAFPLALSLAGAFWLGCRQLWTFRTLSFWYCIGCMLVLGLSLALYRYGAINPNVLGCALALGVAMAFAYQYWWYIPIGIGGLVYCQSRGAILAAVAAGLITLWRLDKRLGLAYIILTAIVVWLIPLGQSETVLQRFGIWQDTMNHFTILGSGFGSFADAYRGFSFHTNMTEILAQHTYNDAIELIFELGIGSIALWLLVIDSFEARAPEIKLVLWTFFALGLTYFPFYIPILGHTFVYALGYLTSLRTSS